MPSRQTRSMLSFGSCSSWWFCARLRPRSIDLNYGRRLTPGLSACGGCGEDGVERGDEAVVLRRRSDRGPQAPVPPGPDRDIADEEALLEETCVDIRRLLVLQPEEDEVRHRPEDIDRPPAPKRA